MVYLKSEQEIEQIEASGKILARLLRELKSRAVKGANLLDLEGYARRFIKENGATPAFLGYQPEGADKPFPAAVCFSLNDIVVHGIPFDYSLQEGDVLKIDSGVVYEGMYSDSALTVGIGKLAPRIPKLLRSAQTALEKAIALARPGKTLGDIGYAIEKQAHNDGFFVLKGLTGHGVGYGVHEDPVVLNHGRRGTGLELKPGMVLAIEPMFSMGTEDIIQKKDESYASADGSVTAQFEHTIAITRTRARILTQLE